MFKKSLLLLSFAVLTASLAFAGPEGDGQKAPEAKPKAHAFVFQDNSFSYAYGDTFREPFIATYDTSGNAVKSLNIPKNIITFTHVDGGNKFGDNIFAMQYLMSNRTNPESGTEYHSNLTVGAKDVYMTYRHNVALSRLFPNAKFSFGPVKDVLVVMGADFGVKNDDFGSQRRSPMFGPGVSLKVPNHGFWDVSAMWTREWNTEGTDVTSWEYVTAYGHTIPEPQTWGQKVVYDPSYTLQTTWGVPLTVGKQMVMFEGFGTFNGSKGYGAPELKAFTTNVWTRKGTKPETLIHTTLKYNVGKFFGEGHNWQIGGGYEYWNNKFGTDHHKYKGCIANTPFVELTIHL